jgi:hypothetical protein
MRVCRPLMVSLLLATTALGHDKRNDKDFTAAVLRSHRNAAAMDSGANRAEYVVETKDRRYTLTPATKFSLKYSVLFQKPPGTELRLFVDSRKHGALVRLGGRESRYSITRIEVVP